MYSIRSLALLSTILLRVTARPQIDKQSGTNELRLIKTSATDEGKWVTEDQKITDYRAKGINFIDVTDETDPDTVNRLSDTNDTLGRAPGVTYPVTITHQTEAKLLIAKANIDGPKSWLKSLTK